jgi:hypothetical protein
MPMSSCRCYIATGEGIVSTRDFGAFHSLDTAAFSPEREFSLETHGLTETLAACSDGCTALLVVHDKATRHMSGQLVAWLAQRGSRIAELADGTGLALVLRNGELVDEVLSEGGDARLNVMVADRALSLLSSVTDPTTRSEISVDGLDYARATRGFNVLLLRDTGQVVSAAFDTDAVGDLILPDGGRVPSLLAEGETVGAPGQVLADRLIDDISGPVSRATPDVSVARLLTEDASLYDVLARCRQSCTMAISVKDEAAANLPFAVRRLAAQMGLTLAELSFRDGYAAIVQNGTVLVQGRSDDEIVDVSERIGERRIQVRSAGFEAGSMASILVDGEELSLGQRGLNIAAIFDGGEAISYHFDTHGGV